jgi:hypothetical protein
MLVRSVCLRRFQCRTYVDNLNLNMDRIVETRRTASAFAKPVTVQDRVGRSFTSRSILHRAPRAKLTTSAMGSNGVSDDPKVPRMGVAAAAALVVEPDTIPSGHEAKCVHGIYSSTERHCVCELKLCSNTCHA